MPVPQISLPSRPLLRDDVHRRLRDAIVDGTLAPGEQLHDAALADWLGVSRTPIREALLELSRAGLVQATPGRSTVVSPIDPAAISDAQTVVAAMHALAVRQAVPKMTSADIDRMRTANRDFAAAQQAGDVDGALHADARVHAVAISVSGNAAAASVIAQYEPVLHRAERLRFASHEGAASVARHDRLIELCAAGDADAAARLCEQTWHSLVLTAHDAPDTDVHTDPDTDPERPHA